METLRFAAQTVTKAAINNDFWCKILRESILITSSAAELEALHVTLEDDPERALEFKAALEATLIKEEGMAEAVQSAAELVAEAANSENYFSPELRDALIVTSMAAKSIATRKIHQCRIKALEALIAHMQAHGEDTALGYSTMPPELRVVFNAVKKSTALNSVFGDDPKAPLEQSNGT